MKSVVRIFTLLCCLSVFNVSANETAFQYFGLGLENQSFNDVNFDTNFNTAGLAPQLSYSAGQSGQGMRAFAGHQFNQYFAVEGGFTSFGKADFKITEAIIGTDGKVTNNTLHRGSFRTYGFDARVVATYPIGNKMFVKANIGALMWQNKFDTLAGTPEQIEINQVKDNGVSMQAGFGVGYGYSKKVAFSVDFAKTKVAEIDTKTLSVSVHIKF